MAEIVMTDLDDDGTISVFAKGSQLLFTCSEGHWWTVEADSAGKPEKKPREGRDPTGKPASRLRDVDLDAAELGSLRALTETFGTEPLRSMRMRSK